MASQVVTLPLVRERELSRVSRFGLGGACPWAVARPALAGVAPVDRNACAHAQLWIVRPPSAAPRRPLRASRRGRRWLLHPLAKERSRRRPPRPLPMLSNDTLVGRRVGFWSLGLRKLHARLSRSPGGLAANLVAEC